MGILGTNISLGDVGAFALNPFASLGTAAAGLLNPITGNLGALGKGGLGGGGGNQNITVTNEPPSYLKPYLTDVLQQAQNQYYGRGPQAGGQQPATNAPGAAGIGGLFGQAFNALHNAAGNGGQSNTSGWPQYFPYSTVSGFSPTSQLAQSLATSRALAGSPVNAAAQQNILNTLQGNYLYGGPGFNQAYQAAANQIIPQVGSAFGQANRTHSGLAQQALAQGLGNAFAGLYGQERGNQMQALGMAPDIANQGYYDIGQLANVGQTQDVMNQNQLSDLVNRWNYNQNLPYQQLQRYQGFVSGVPAMGGTQSQNIPQPGLGQRLLGGVLGGAGLGQLFGASGGGLAPYALGGALLGGLL